MLTAALSIAHQVAGKSLREEALFLSTPLGCRLAEGHAGFGARGDPDHAAGGATDDPAGPRTG